MRILNITSINIFPSNTGGARLIYGFLKYLSRKHEISLLTVKNTVNFRNDLNIKLYDVLTDNKLNKFFNPLVFFKIKNVIRIERPNLIIIDFPWFGIYGFLIQKIYKIPYIIHEHNIEYVRFKRFKKWWWRMLKQYEKFVYKYAYKILCISPVDKEILINELNVDSKKILDCPYGIDTEIFKPNATKKAIIRKELGLQEEPFVLFFGTLDYFPNIEAIKIIKEEILPRVKKKIPNVKFVIVGKNPPKNIRSGNIIFTGIVFQIEDYINACDFVIIPLLSGGGIRTRIIESIACGKAVISTSLGAEGIDKSICGDRLIIADDWNKFSEEIISLAKNPRKDRIPEKFVERYSWENIVNNLSF